MRTQVSIPAPVEWNARIHVGLHGSQSYLILEPYFPKEAVRALNALGLTSSGMGLPEDVRIAIDDTAAEALVEAGLNHGS